jgi:hypothetical protein
MCERKAVIPIPWIMAESAFTHQFFKGYSLMGNDDFFCLSLEHMKSFNVSGMNRRKRAKTKGAPGSSPLR